MPDQVDRALAAGGEAKGQSWLLDMLVLAGPAGIRHVLYQQAIAQSRSAGGRCSRVTRGY